MCDFRLQSCRYCEGVFKTFFDQITALTDTKMTCILGACYPEYLHKALSGGRHCLPDVKWNTVGRLHVSQGLSMEKLSLSDDLPWGNKSESAGFGDIWALLLKQQYNEYCGTLYDAASWIQCFLLRPSIVHTGRLTVKFSHVSLLKTGS